MTDTFLYKSTAPAVVAAVKAYFSDLEKITEAGHKFAEAFGGKPMFCTLNGSFAGVSWERGTQPADDHLWTKRTNHGLRRPKPGCGAEGAALRQKWRTLWPDNSPKSSNTAWLALVTDIEPNWKYSPGIALTTKAQPVTVYFETSIPFNRNVVELTRTAYDQGIKDD